MTGSTLNHNYRPPLEMEHSTSTSSNNIPNGGHNRNRRYILLNTLRSRISSCCCHKRTIIAISASIILLIVLSLRSDSGEKPSASDHQLDTPPTIIEHYDPREVDILQKLHAVSGGRAAVAAANYQTGSPRYRASEWILKKDDMTLRATDRFLAQRFILAVLYFQGRPEGGDTTKDWGAWMRINESECFWDGVVCGDSGYVEGIKLDNHDLVGTIPNEMGKLKQLKNLDLSSNHLTGVIPSELGALDKLESLILHRNAFTGAVPLQLCHLRNETLTVLIASCGDKLNEVSCNCCTDCDEGGYDGDTHNIDTQHSGINLVSAPTSSKKAILIHAMCERISKGRAFVNESPQNLAMNWMIDDDKSGLEEDNYYLVQRYVMAIVYFSLCEETFDFETWLSPTKNECSFQGVTCDAKNMITGLSFSKAGIVGTLPLEISTLSKITDIDFSKNKISGGIPTSWMSLLNLVTLNLRGNEITGDMSLCSLYNYHSLNTLEIDCNKISCECCSNCDDIDVTIAIQPPEDTSQTTLVPHISVAHSPSQTSIVPHISPPDDASARIIRKELQKVSTVPYYAPNEMRTRAQDWIIFEDSHKLPPASQFLKQRYILVMLYFALDGDNWISTKNDDNWASTTDGDISTSTMWLSTNTDCCYWRGVVCNGDDFVVVIDLSHQNISGTIPYEVAQLFHLNHLNLRSNHIKRSIPDEMGQMSQLESLILDDNDLSGDVPNSVCMLREQGALKKLWADCSSCPRTFECCTHCSH